MAIKVLSPAFLTPPAPSSRVRCQADVSVVGDYAGQWRESVFKEGIRRYSGSERVSQCTFNAVVEIDGLPLCRRHAGMIVLDRYVKGELIERAKNDE